MKLQDFNNVIKTKAGGRVTISTSMNKYMMKGDYKKVVLLCDFKKYPNREGLYYSFTKISNTLVCIVADRGDEDIYAFYAWPEDRYLNGIETLFKLPTPIKTETGLYRLS